MKWVLLVQALTKAMQRFLLAVVAAPFSENLFGAMSITWDEHWTQVRWENHFFQLLSSVKHLQNCKKFPFTDSWGEEGSIKLNPAALKSCLRTSHQHLAQGTELFMFCSGAAQCRTSFSDFSWCFQGLGHWMFFARWLSFQRPQLISNKVD